MGDKNKEDTIVGLFKKNSAPKVRESVPLVQGDGNVIISGGGNIVNMASGPVRITPGRGHITESQAVRIKYLVHEVARLECIHSSNPVFVGAVWEKLKERMGVTSYRLIPHGHFHEAEQFLLDWRARVLRDSKRAPQEVKDRARVFRICHAIAKQYNLYAEMRALLRVWLPDAQRPSMRDLDSEQLQRLLAFMRGLEAQARGH